MDNKKLVETIRSAQNGDHKALEILYLEYAKPVYYLALKLLKNKEDAEDITQEVFITVFEKISELREPELFTSWLNRITANKCTNKLTRNKEPMNSDLGDLEISDFIEENDPLLIPEKSLDNSETARMIVEIIDNLPTPQRVCIYYYYYEHLTVAQIAENLNTNENTVKTRLSLARDKIRKELERLNKDEGLKLYGFTPLMLTPILNASLKNFELSQDVLSGILGNIAAKSVTKSVIAANSVNSAKSVSAVAKAVTIGLKAKIAIAASVITLAGVTTGAIIAVKSGDNSDLSAHNSQTLPEYTDNFEAEEENNTDYVNEIKFYPAADKNERGNSTGNITNNGIAAIKDGWIYYIDYDLNLQKIREDGSDKTMLIEGGCISNINVVADWVYCSGGGGIYRIRTNGKEKAEINDLYVSSMTVIGDWIYTSVLGEDDKGIYKMRTDGKELRLIHSGDYNTIDNINATGEWIYFTYGYSGQLYKIRTDGTELTLLSDDNYTAINVIGDWIYCTTDFYTDDSNYYGCLCKIRTDGTEKTFLYDDDFYIANMNVAENRIYGYTFNSENDYDGVMYKYNLDNNFEKDKLIENRNHSINLNVVGDWIYYKNNDNNDKHWYIYKIRTDGTENQFVD